MNSHANSGDEATPPLPFSLAGAIIFGVLDSRIPPAPSSTTCFPAKFIVTVITTGIMTRHHSHFVLALLRRASS